MTLLGLPFAQLAMLFAVIGGLVTALYILKLRRRRIAVPFAQLWERVLKESQSDSLFHRLKRLLSLLLQLAFVLLVIFAIGNPRLSTSVLEERRVILLLDTSASMKATDARLGSRMQTAIAEVRKLIDGKAGSDAMMLVQMDAQVTPLTGFSTDEKALLAALDKVEANDTRADLGRALTFCADALAGQKNPMLVLIGDGAYDAQVFERVRLRKRKAPPKERRAASQPASRPRKRPDLDRIALYGIGLHFVPVGPKKSKKLRGNVGIVAFSARRYPTNRLSFEMFLEVVNYRNEPTRADLQIYADGALNDIKRIELAPKKRVRYTCSPDARRQGKKSWCDMAAAGELIEARLVPAGSHAGSKQILDDFRLDDRAFALLPKRRKMRVLVVTRGNLFLEGALLLDENLELTRVKPREYKHSSLAGMDAVVFDAFAPKRPATVHSLWVNPPPTTQAFKVAKRLNRPVITEQDLDHPVMRYVRLKDVNISHSAQFIKRDGDLVLAASFRAPVLVAREHQHRRSVAIGFDPRRSDLPLRVAFPLLVINTFNWFSGDDEGLITTYRTGDTWRVPLDPRDIGSKTQYVEVLSPMGRALKAPLAGNVAVLFGQKAGLYRIKQAGGDLRLAANLADSRESDITPLQELTVEGAALQPPAGFSIKIRREIWIYLLLLAACLLLLEWLTYNRRLTV